jgi:alpha-mannosidase
MKKCEDDSTVVVRLYENAGRSTSGQLHFYTPVAKAEETNLLEESSATISSNGKEVALQVGHNEIQTIRITPTR